MPNAADLSSPAIPSAGRRGAHLQVGAAAMAHAFQARQASKTARGRMEAAAPKPVKRVAAKPVGPTPERLAKGDTIRTAAGFHRSMAPVERLYREKKLGETREHVRENLALFEAAVKLKEHYDSKNALGIQAQNLDGVRGDGLQGVVGDLCNEERWVWHSKEFETAMKLMGYWPASPTRGSAKIVEAVVCLEMTVTDAAEAILPAARKEVMGAAAMEKLKQGLFVLAMHWGMLRG